MKIIKKNKDLLKGILAIFLYFTISLFKTLPFDMCNIDYNSVNESVKVIYSMTFLVLIGCIMIIIFYDKLQNDLSDILDKHQEYYSKAIKYYLMGLVFMFISNFIIIFGFGNGLNGNEIIVRSNIKEHFIYMFISGVIYAPIVEELVFRQSIRNICGRTITFIVISAFVFSGLHAIVGANELMDLINIFPYLGISVAFAYMLYKFDNIFVSMGIHFMHNGIMMALQFLVLLLS